MKKKNGFTLIELLAVIVVLVIVVLITIPLITKVVDNARKNAAKNSALNYLDSVEKYIMYHDVDSEKYPYDLKDYTWNISDSTEKIPPLNDFIKVNGSKPASGTITIDSKGKVSGAQLVIGKYGVECVGNKCNVSKESVVETEITILNTDTKLYVGFTLQINAIISPEGESVIWESSDTDVATVSNTGLVTGVAEGNVTITAKIGKKEDSIILNVEKAILNDLVEIGDVIKMTPTSASYTIYGTGSSSQEINPSLANVWRVIRIKDDETIELVSEYAQKDISGNGIKFFGSTGYQKLVGILNTIAAQYYNDDYTITTHTKPYFRHIGYNGQTENLSSLSCGGSSTPTAIVPEGIGREYGYGVGGDTLYITDVNLVRAAYKAKDNSLSDSSALIKSSGGYYWLASRIFRQESDWCQFNVRVVYYNGGLDNPSLAEISSSGKRIDYSGGVSAAIRPIITLKPNLEVKGGDGQSIETAWELK